MSIVTAQALTQLLQEASASCFHTHGPINLLATTALHKGMSGAPVERHHFMAHTATGTQEFSLITKEALLHERRVLALLNQQGHTQVPFAYVPDLVNDAPAMICMQDLGERHRPTSLTPVTNAFLLQEATGLASIHARNMAQRDALSWLPPLDGAQAFAHLQTYWLPTWKRAVANNAFACLFHDIIPLVEHWASVLPDAIAALYKQDSFCTLIHTDIHPGNVLIHGGHSYFVDWQVPHYGPFYLDLPHHFHTRAMAEPYRLALSAAGYTLLADEFDHGYITAARFIGLRYIWWTLDSWLNEAIETRWVEHYLGMILQDALVVQEHNSY